MKYVPLHCHTELSLLDSRTSYKEYVDFCVDNDIKAIAFTEHGNVYQHFNKRDYCRKRGVKYIHGIEVYLTSSHENKKRDNYHTVLLAKNREGYKEINSLVKISSEDTHKYYKNRLSFKEFFNISDNVIKISACLQSPLNHKDEIDKDVYEKLVQHYDYLEIQPHDCKEQKVYNKYLYSLSIKYNKPLVATGDFHSINKYKAECRTILQKAKGIEFSGEDEFDLIIKNYNDFRQCFIKQNCLPISVIEQALENTNTIANLCEEIEDTTNFKYPIVSKNDERDLKIAINTHFKQMIDSGIIPREDTKVYISQIREEMRVFKKVGMLGFILFMHQLSIWCEENNIPRGFGRGSCCGSTICYILKIIDVDPIKAKTVFSRFCNEDRVEAGDIDVDYSPEDRDKVYNYIINRFGIEKTAFILSVGTVAEKGTIDEICRALNISIEKSKQIKNEYELDPNKARNTYKDVFYYFDGIYGGVISVGFHPAGIIASPLNLIEEYGCSYDRDGRLIICIDMEECHDVGLIKYDILGLKNIGIIKKTCSYAGIPYPKNYTLNFADKKVYNDINTCKSPVGLFQFEGDFAFNSLQKYTAHSVDDLTLVTACIRPSGETYRDKVFQHIKNEVPSQQVENILKDTLNWLVYQEQVLAFLQECCGFSGSKADTLRRAIGKKNKEVIDKMLPDVLEGYCKLSDKDRKTAKEECKQFLDVIESASSYSFGKNHAYAYSMITYTCAYLRYYYPVEFCTAYLNMAEQEIDIVNGTALAKEKGITISTPRFQNCDTFYTFDKEKKIIYKGLKSIKGLNKDVGEKLKPLTHVDNFLDLLVEMKNSKIGDSNIETLIKLNFFEKFGSINTLLKFYNAFTSLYRAKILDKTKKYPLNIEFLRRFCKKETEKQLRDFDGYNCLKESLRFLPDLKMSTLEQAKYQLQYFGYIDIIDNTIPPNVYFVCDVVCKGTKEIRILQLYSINNGSVKQAKLYKSVYIQNPIKIGDIIVTSELVCQNKWERIDGEFIKSATEFENILKKYKVA